VGRLGPQIGDQAQEALSTLKAQPERGADFNFTVGLAPSFGKLNKEELTELDTELKAIIATTTTLLGRLPKEKHTWEKVVEVLAQSPMLEPLGDGIVKSDEYSLKNFTWLALDGKPDPIARAKVGAWFRALIGDTDVLDSTKVDIGWCEWMVCKTGSEVKRVWEYLGKAERIDRTLVDIGVLRYPTKENPYFKVFRIKLRVWAYSKRIASVQSDDHGVIGEYQCQKYRACSDVIEMLSEKAKRSAARQTEALLGLGDDEE